MVNANDNNDKSINLINFDIIKFGRIEWKRIKAAIRWNNIQLNSIPFNWLEKDSTVFNGLVGIFFVSRVQFARFRHASAHTCELSGCFRYFIIIFLFSSISALCIAFQRKLIHTLGNWEQGQHLDKMPQIQRQEWEEEHEEQGEEQEEMNKYFLSLYN